MTLEELQQYLHVQYQGDTATPETTDDDWDVRVDLLYDAINAWDTGTVDDEKMADGILWSELWVMLSDAVDGDKTTVTNTADYDAPSNFRFPGGFVRLVDSNGGSDYYEVKKAHEIELHRNEDVKLCWFTGNKKVGFTLHFLTAPTAGLTIEYPYYKEPFLPSSASDSLEMSDPWFAIKYILSKLHEIDGEGDRALLALTLAKAKLKAMKARNQTPVWFQDNRIPDSDFATGTSGFGE